MWICIRDETSGISRDDVCPVCGNTFAENEVLGASLIAKGRKGVKTAKAKRKAKVLESPRPDYTYHIVVGVLVFVAAYFFAGVKIGNTHTPVSEPIPTQMVASPTRIVSTTRPTSTPEITRTRTPTAKPTNTLQSVRTRTPSASLSCPGAPPQRLEMNEDAIVCTETDRVFVRSGPGKGFQILYRIPPRTVVWILDGPTCADNWSWWQVELNDGTVGWMSEGGDSEDRYYLCPN